MLYRLLLRSQRTRALLVSALALDFRGGGLLHRLLLRSECTCSLVIRPRRLCLRTLLLRSCPQLRLACGLGCFFRGDRFFVGSDGRVAGENSQRRDDANDDDSSPGDQAIPRLLPALLRLFLFHRRFSAAALCKKIRRAFEVAAVTLRPCCRRTFGVPPIRDRRERQP